MKQLLGTDIWTLHHPNNWIVITTNGSVNYRGQAVMGRGLALQAAQRFPGLHIEVGNAIKLWGNTVNVLHSHRLITFPVKHKWMQTADLELIRTSAHQLLNAWDQISQDCFGARPRYSGHIYLPRPGCNNGGRTWAEVRPILAPILDDRFTVVEIKPE